MRPICRAPQARDDLAAGDRHRHGEPGALGIAHRLDRQVARVVVLVLGVLHAVAVDHLREIALAIQQADADEVQPLVAGRLAVIAGEHAKAAGVDREAVVEAVLGAEIRHQRRAFERRRVHVLVEHLEHFGVAGAVTRIGGSGIERFLVDAAQQLPRIAAHLAPERGRELLEQRPGRPVPAEEEVVGEFRQAAQAGGDLRGYFECQGGEHRGGESTSRM